jgi:hypothetical protein
LVSDFILVEFAKSNNEFPSDTNSSFFSKFESKFISQWNNIFIIRISEFGQVAKDTENFDQDGLISWNKNKVNYFSKEIKV